MLSRAELPTKFPFHATGSGHLHHFDIISSSVLHMNFLLCDCAHNEEEEGPNNGG